MKFTPVDILEKATQQISFSSKFILVTQKGIHTKDKFDLFFPVYNKSEIFTDWLTSQSDRGHSAFK